MSWEQTSTQNSKRERERKMAGKKTNQTDIQTFLQTAASFQSIRKKEKGKLIIYFKRYVLAAFAYF